MFVIRGFPDESIANDYVKSIDIDYNKIHAGYLYEANNKFTLTSGTNKAISITTPTNGQIHYRPSNLNCSADKVTIALYEDATITAETGTEIIINNHNRINNNPSTILLLNEPTITIPGIKIAESYLPGSVGVGQSRSGSELGQGSEWVLKPNTTYIILITNGSSSDNTVSIKQNWYEVI